MRIVVMTVGQGRGALAEGADGFADRAKHYWKLSELSVPDGVRGRNVSPERVRAEEGERILGRVPEALEIVALTREGKSMSSPAFARWLGNAAISSAPGFVFVIGGAFGLSPEVLSKAARTLSLSSFTLPHELARVTLMEQLYRAGTILRGEPYHKG